MFYPAQKCEFSGNRVVYILYMGLPGEEIINTMFFSTLAVLIYVSKTTTTMGIKILRCR